MRHMISGIVFISSVLVAAPALAGDYAVSVEQKTHSQQFLSKRPYANPVVLAKADAEQSWTGATLRVDQDPFAKQQQVMKLHMIGKRAY